MVERKERDVGSETGERDEAAGDEGAETRGATWNARSRDVSAGREESGVLMASASNTVCTEKVGEWQEDRQ